MQASFRDHATKNELSENLNDTRDACSQHLKALSTNHDVLTVHDVQTFE